MGIGAHAKAVNPFIPHKSNFDSEFMLNDDSDEDFVFPSNIGLKGMKLI